MSGIVEPNGAVCYYSVLGIGKHSTDDEIRCAYRKLALKWHPDRWIKDPKLALEAKKRFQHVQEAYSVLYVNKLNLFVQDFSWHLERVL
ncbi:DnaJ-like subfamily B member 6 [Spatholobus suberectus]|nr:DnaJ-like subfamily B member 6 [Spatholobus suberectus]